MITSGKWRSKLHWEDEREVRGGEEFNVCVAGTGEAGEGGRKERSCVCECIDNKA